MLFFYARYHFLIEIYAGSSSCFRPWMTVSGTMSRSKRSVKSPQETTDTLIPYLEEAIKNEEALNILCNMTNFDVMEIKAAWRDFRFGMRHIRDFHRCALVGASKWVEWCVKITVPFFKLEVRLFQTGQEKEARNWFTD